MVQMGIPTTPSAVARNERMNAYIIPVASRAPRIRFFQTLNTEACTYTTSSAVRASSMPSGLSRSRLMFSTSAIMASLMAITLEPLSRRTDRLMTGRVLT